MSCVVGVDPGLKGGIVVLDKYEGIKELFVMPLIGKEIDIKSLINIVYDYCQQKHIFLEKVTAMHKQKAVSGFKFGKVAGIIEASLMGPGTPMTLIQPKTWQKIAHEGTNKKDHPKVRSLQAVKRLFPQDDFFATERSTVFHDGLVDAALIAYYGLKQL